MLVPSGSHAKYRSPQNAESRCNPRSSRVFNPKIAHSIPRRPIIRSGKTPSGRMNRKTEHSSRARGKLKIGDDWNAITIIALSQTSPLKAIAELVENSIDAKSHTVTITRGREHRRHFISIRYDGEGVPLDNTGRPYFRYVAYYICDSV